jgi:lipopolysaccharide/colanic/teichoic acid biosynthesis glycosyltransferase
MLRKFKIDELPQLFNVLKGDMSLVGPRPEVEEYVTLYEKDYREILKRRPGITDISSIIFREEEAVLKNQVDPEGYYKKILLPEKIRLAKEYIENSSFLYDLKLVLNTLHRIFYPPDVSRDGYRQKIIRDSSKEN